MAWTKEPALESSGGPACLCCGTPTLTFAPEATIAVGFGCANVTKDGKEVYSEPMIYIDEKGDDIEAPESAYWTGADAEKAAAADPDHDWRILKAAPLYEAEYQRHGEGQWVMIRRGEGFA